MQENTIERERDFFPALLLNKQRKWIHTREAIAFLEKDVYNKL